MAYTESCETQELVQMLRRIQAADLGLSPAAETYIQLLLKELGENVESPAEETVAASVAEELTHEPRREEAETAQDHEQAFLERQTPELAREAVENKAEEAVAASIAEELTPEPRLEEAESAQDHEQAFLERQTPEFAREAVENKVEALLNELQYATEDGRETSVLEEDIRLLASGDPRIEGRIAGAKQRGMKAKKERERLARTLEGGICSPAMAKYWQELPRKANWFLRKATKGITWRLRKELELLCRREGKEAALALLYKAKNIFGSAVAEVTLPKDCGASQGVAAPNVLRGTEHTLFSRKAVQEWNIYIDETGERFSEDESGVEGRVVAVCVRQGSALKNLGAFHSTDAGTTTVWQHFNTLLQSDCAIFGCTRSALNIQGPEGWLQCVRELVKWVWRLLPLQKNGQPVRLSFHIEQRQGYSADLATTLGTKMLEAELGRENPTRSEQMRLFNFSFESKNAPMLAWADIVAYLWGRSKQRAFAAFKNSSLEGTSLIDCDPALLQACECILRGDVPDGNAWVLLMENVGSSKSLQSYALAKLNDRCIQEERLWETYAKAMEDYLLGKKYQMRVLDRMSDWLEPMQSPSLVANFLRHMANLAHCNHLGDICSSSMKNSVSTLERLAPEIGKLDPMAPLHFMLRLCVSDTNAFDFVQAEERLAPWNPSVNGQLTGSANWDGRILSSLGQCRAFQNDPRGAIRLFEEALAQFDSLAGADEKKGKAESAQTKSYLAFAQMDCPGYPQDSVRKTVEDVLGCAILDAPRELDKQELALTRYQHQLLARYLVCAGSADEREAYLRYSDTWTQLDRGFQPGHPWPQIQYFRWLLLEEDAPLAESLKNSLAVAKGRDNMPTVELIVMAIAIAMGVLQPAHPPVRAILLQLDSMLRGAGAIVRQLLAASPGDRMLAKQVLPFNFC